MCLTTTSNHYRIAREDIICYKIYKRLGDEEFSPYLHVPRPEIGVICKTNLGNPCEIAEYYTIEEGFHSFMSKEDAKRCASLENFVEPVIYKCIIPKGSKYYEGFFGLRPSYCSDTIVITGEKCLFLHNILNRLAAWLELSLLWFFVYLRSLYSHLKININFLNF